MTTVLTPGGPSLLSGQYYSLIVLPTDANSFVGGYLNNQTPAPTGQLYQTLNGMASSVSGSILNAFDLKSPASSPVPEPSSLFQLGSASLIGLAYGWWRRRGPADRKPRMVADACDG